MEFSDSERERISRMAAALAKNVPPSSHYLELARAYSQGKISALRYSEPQGGYVYYVYPSNVKRVLPEEQFQERAVMLCRSDTGDLYTKPIPTLPGDLGAKVEKSVCYPDRPVGVLHTHPAAAVFPSPEDIAVMRDRDISVMCVAGRDERNDDSIYPTLCFYRYDWVDSGDVLRAAEIVDEKIRSLVATDTFRDVFRIDVYDKNGIRFTYIFPPPGFTRYVVSRLREDPALNSVFDVEYRVYREGEV